MDKEVKKYLIEKCKEWMLPDERKALGQLDLNEHDINNVKKSRLVEKKMEWVFGIGDEKVTELVKIGRHKLENKIATRLLKDNIGIVNRCPKCDKIARTPKARQCRFCAHKWFDEA